MTEWTAPMETMTSPRFRTLCRGKRCGQKSRTFQERKTSKYCTLYRTNVFQKAIGINFLLLSKITLPEMQNRRFVIGSEVTITLPGQGGIYHRNELEG